MADFNAFRPPPSGPLDPNMDSVIAFMTRRVIPRHQVDQVFLYSAIHSIHQTTYEPPDYIFEGRPRPVSVPRPIEAEPVDATAPAAQDVQDTTTEAPRRSLRLRTTVSRTSPSAPVHSRRQTTSEATRTETRAPRAQPARRRRAVTASTSSGKKQKKKK